MSQLPHSYDFSNGSFNRYTIEMRHGLVPQCPHCRQFRNITLDGIDYFRFFVKDEGHVQMIFPYLTAAQRELLVSGVHPECWDAFIGPEPKD